MVQASKAKRLRAVSRSSRLWIGRSHGTVLWVWLVAMMITLLTTCLATPPPTLPTSSPSFAPPTFAPTTVGTNAPTLPAPGQTTSRRISTQQDCFKQGRQVNCAWNPQVVVFDGFSRICEPTDSFLNISTPNSVCLERTNQTCRFDSSAKCILLNDQLCRDAPLFRLIERGKELMRRSSGLSTGVVQLPMSIQDVLRRSHICADISNNVTCSASRYCVWIPSPETPSITVTEGISTASPAVPAPTRSGGATLSPTVSAGDASQVPETQIIEVLSSSEAVRPDNKQVRITPPRKLHERLVTITSQVRWATRPENQTRIASGWFRVALGADAISDPIAYNASSLTLQTTLRKVPGMNDAIVTSNVNRTDEWGRMSWVVNATNAISLQVNEVAFNDSDNARIPGDTARVTITRHQRNTQILMMFGPTSPTDGNFLLGYTWVDFADDWGDFHRRRKDSFPPFSTMLPIPERFQPNEPPETFADKLNKFEYSNTKVLDWVTVSKPDAGMMQRLSQRAAATGINKGNPLRNAWIIEFTTLVSEYERAEFPLTVMSNPVIGPNGISVPFYGVLGEGEAIMDFSVQMEMPSPVIHGRLGKPALYTTNDPLPGLHTVDPNNASRVFATWRNASLKSGDCFRLEGNFYRVSSIEVINNETVQNVLMANLTVPSAYHSVLTVEPKVTLPQHPNDTSVMRTIGWRAFACRPIVEGPASSVATPAQVPSISMKDSALQIKTAIEAASGGFYSKVNVSVYERDRYGQLSFDVTITDADGAVPRLAFYPVESADVILPSSSNPWNPAAESKIEIVDLIPPGIARPTGTFRLVFAGYGGKDETALKLFESPLSPFYPNSPTRLEDDAGRLDFANSDGSVSTLYYSMPLSVADLRDPEAMITALQSLTPTIVEFRSTGFAVDVLSNTQTRVKFLLNSIQFASIWNVSANVPQLLVVSDVRRGSPTTRGLLGTGASIRVFTETQGVGTLYNQIVSSDKAEFPLRSPCRVENTIRKQDLTAALGDFASLAKLDELALNCAYFGGNSRTKCVGPDAVVEGCVWRGPDATLLTEPPMGVDPRYLSRFWSTDDMFRWGEYSVPINSNCTLSPVVAVQYLVRMLRPMYNKLAEYNSSTTTPFWLQEIETFSKLYLQVQTEVEKFDRCSKNPVVEANATQGGFVDVWQWLVTTTSYTCMLAYGLAGALLAYRMDKFKLLGFKLRDAASGVMIILGSVCMGGMYGFVIGAVPAALISQMYASIPVNLSTDWAISLGVALGILIVYFDMGRGGAEAEIAFKRGY